MFLITKIRNGYLLMPTGRNVLTDNSESFYLASVPAEVEEAFKLEAEARSTKTELKAISGSLADLPVLTDTHMAA